MSQRGDAATALGMKRATEMAAMFMIGDGLLGLFHPERHVELWRSDVAAVDALVKPFGGRSGRRRLYGAVQVGVGLLLASRLRAK